MIWPRSQLAAAALAALALLAGCATSGPGLAVPPSPHPAVNAALPKHQPNYTDTSTPDAATVLIATCTGWKKFGETQDGQWTNLWYDVTFTVNRVERGAWPEATLTFLCHESLPHPGTGLKYQRQSWPYERGVQMRFFLDQSHTPPRITGQVWLANPAPAAPAP